MEDLPSKIPRSPLTWVPSLYFMQGLPAVIVIQLSVIMYKQLGLPNATAALISSLLILPWVGKIVVATIVERYFTKKIWLVATQCCFIPLLLLLALSLYAQHFIILSMIALIGLGFLGVINDISSDGVYLINLPLKQQAAYVGVQMFSFHAANLLAKSGILFFISVTALVLSMKSAWQCSFLLLTPVFILFSAYHYWRLPESEECINRFDVPSALAMIATELTAPRQWLLIVFILVFEAAQGQLGKVVPLFLIDSHAVGGLALTTNQLAGAYGLIGTTFFMLGAFASGWWMARYYGLTYLVPCTFIYFLSTFIYVALSRYSLSLPLISILYAVAQFINGLINSLYMFMLLKIANQAQYKTTVYACLTSLMLASLLIFGTLSGVMQTLLGYQGFFYWIASVAFLTLLFTISIKKHYQLL